MTSHLLVLLIFSLAPSYSYMFMFRRAEIPDEPPILHVGEFDLWRNRVIGNGWDIQENLITGPNGFYWQKNKATDTPPSLPPPLNEIVWCSGGFLEKVYGRPTWSVDMSRFRREPTLMEVPNTSDFHPAKPPILHLRGFDLWRNRVIGNGWDIQENMITGPDGFSWQKNKATDLPPSLPPPLNEIVWCTGCFLEKAYGKPTWSVDMSRFRREPTLMEVPNTNDFQSEGQTQSPKIKDNDLTKAPIITSPPKIELAKSEKEISPPSDIIKLSPKEDTQPPNSTTLVDI